MRTGNVHDALALGANRGDTPRTDMTQKSSDQVVRAVAQRVVDSFTAQGALFTGLDVSNAVKGTLPDVRHREVSPVVRDLFSRGAMGEYTQTLIDVMAEGSKPAQAYLYHLPEHDASYYDDSMRSQLAIPPVSTSTTVDDGQVTAHSTESPVVVGRDGRGRVPRQLLLNAGVVGDVVYAVSTGHPGKVSLRSPTGLEDDDDMGSTLDYEHPSLLHIPRRLMGVFTAGRRLEARVLPGEVELVEV